MTPELTRRGFIVGTLATAGALASGSELLQGVAQAAEIQASPYSADAFFTSRIDAAPVDDVATVAFRSFMTTNATQKAYAYPLIRGIGSNRWGTPFAIGTASDPVWTLSGGTLPAACSDLRTVGFHAPAWLADTFTGTGDSPLLVLDQATGQSVWASGVSKGTGSVVKVGRSAGRFMHGTNGLDRRNPLSNGLKNERSRGAIPDAMVIRRDLVEQAKTNGTGLGHVLHCFFVETLAASKFCHPMTGAESGKYGWGAEGQRLRVKPSIDLASRVPNAEGLVIARTLQQHGAYLGDNAGSATGLKAEQQTAKRNPWLGSTIKSTSLAGLTWSDFEVVPKGWQS